MSPPPWRRVDDVSEEGQVGEPQCVAGTPSLDDEVDNQQQRDQHERGERGGIDERHRRTFSICRNRTSARSQSPEVETVTCGTPAERNIWASWSRSAEAAVAKRSRMRRSRVSTCSC